ncbi:hypothetical protein ACFLZ1_04070 [Patescibacteria group bacterium]
MTSETIACPNFERENGCDQSMGRGLCSKAKPRYNHDAITTIPFCLVRQEFLQAGFHYDVPKQPVLPIARIIE